MVANRPTDLGRGVVGADGWGWVMFYRAIAWIQFVTGVFLSGVGEHEMAACVIAMACFSMLADVSDKLKERQ